MLARRSKLALMRAITTGSTSSSTPTSIDAGAKIEVGVDELVEAVVIAREQGLAGLRGVVGALAHGVDDFGIAGLEALPDAAVEDLGPFAERGAVGEVDVGQQGRVEGLVVAVALALHEVAGEVHEDET